MAGYRRASALADSAVLRLAGAGAIGAKPRAPAARRSQHVTEHGPCPAFKQALRRHPDAQTGRPTSSDRRHDRTFIPRSTLHRHAAGLMVHWAMTGPPTMLEHRS